MIESINFEMLESFRDFLDKQEAKLADALLFATIPAISSATETPLHLHGSGHFRLSQAMQVMASRIRNLHEGENTKKEWRIAVETIEKAFWDYIEILEDAVEQLVQHMYSDVSMWSIDFYDAITGFKELLAHRIEDLTWVHRRVEELLFAYRLICNHQKNIWMIFGKILNRFMRALDKSLLTHLSRAEEKLNEKYKIFDLNYLSIKALIPEIQENETKFAQFPGFITLTQQQRNLLVRLYRLISLGNDDITQELLRKSINNLGNSESIGALFQDYLSEIKNKGAIKKEELIFLKNMIRSYREIFKTSDFSNLLQEIDTLLTAKY